MQVIAAIALGLGVGIACMVDDLVICSTPGIDAARRARVRIAVEIVHLAALLAAWVVATILSEVAARWALVCCLLALVLGITASVRDRGGLDAPGAPSASMLALASAPTQILCMAAALRVMKPDYGVAIGYVLAVLLVPRVGSMLARGEGSVSLRQRLERASGACVALAAIAIGVLVATS